ncbi:MAG: branched-chain amino acid ABC transporter permease [Clostridia bacterium]|nr:branched-chain amino acid ABC transporter permease [Clostridia bacterium]
MNFIETLINGLSMGSTYAMIALGYTMVYGIAKMLNFAHGDVIMVGGYTMFVVLMMGGNPFLAVAAAVVFCMVLGITIEKVAYKPLRGASPLAVLITAIGMSYLLQSLALIVFGSAPKMVNIADLGNLTFGGLSVPVYTLVTLGCSVVIMVVLTLFVKYTRTGRAMVAVSEDKDAAQLMGINVNKIIMITFGIGSALAAFAGLFMLMKSPSLTNTLGAMPGIKAFTAAVIGGIGSIPGAMVGGLLMGVVEAISLTIPPIAPYTDAIEFIILIIILLVRPTGLLGKKRREKV